MWTYVPPVTQHQSPETTVESVIPTSTLIDLMSKYGEGTHQFTNNQHTIVLRGIPEDFRVLYNGQLLFEVVYDSVWNIAKEQEELIREIFRG